MNRAAAWDCVRAARRQAVGQRLPFDIVTTAGAVSVGSVARAHLAALARWRPELRVENDRLRLQTAAPLDAWFDAANRRLHADGLIRAWRDEPYGVTTRRQRMPVAVIERASSRFWGTLTFGAHCNGYVADAAGRPTHLWIGQRSASKATDPGLLDNLVGGGVPWPQTPRDTLLREAWEEAGLSAEELAAATNGSVFELRRDLPEGLQHEELHVFDLQLPAGRVPVNQDGEVEAFHCLSVDDALTRAARGDMTVDAALATLDFALRRRLLPEEEADALARAAQALRLA